MKANFSDHSANERTFLAWIRTGIAVMAFGFLVEKFTLFLHYIGHALHEKQIPANKATSVLGLSFILLGASMIAMATVKFVRFEKEIDSVEVSNRSFFYTDIAIGALIAIAGYFLVFYLGMHLTF